MGLAASIRNPCLTRQGDGEILWGARAPRPLCHAPRGTPYPSRKELFGEAPKSAREAHALPGKKPPAERPIHLLTTSPWLSRRAGLQPAMPQESTRRKRVSRVRLEA